MKGWSDYLLFYLSVLVFSFILIQEDKVQIQVFGEIKFHFGLEYNVSKLIILKDNLIVSSI